MPTQQSSPEKLNGAHSRKAVLEQALKGLGVSIASYEQHANTLYSSEVSSKLLAEDEDAVVALLRELRDEPKHGFTPARDESIVVPQSIPEDPIEQEHQALLREARQAVFAAHKGEGK